MQTLFENILILMNPSQQLNTGSLSAAQTSEAWQFNQAQNYLNAFVQEQQKSYRDFYGVVVQNNELDQLVGSGRINDSQTQSIKFWMINALIQIAQSDDFIVKWTDQERVEFKNYFFEWLRQNWKLITKHPFLMRKLQSLLNSIFQGMVLAKHVETQDNQYIGLNPTNQPLGCNVFAEFIHEFLKIDNYQGIATLLNQSMQSQQPVAMDANGLSNPDELTAISVFSAFALESILDCFKSVINFSRDEDEEEKGENGEEEDEERESNMMVPAEQKGAYVPITKRIDIQQKIYLQRVFNYNNSFDIIHLVRTIIAYKHRGLLQHFQQGGQVVQILCWKVLNCMLKFKFYGFVPKSQSFKDDQNSSLGGQNSANSVDKGQQPSQQLLEIFNEFLSEARSQIETNQDLDQSVVASEQIFQSIQYLRYSLKFLSNYIKSDVQVELMNSVQDISDDQFETMKHSSKQIESSINDLEIKLQLVKLVSQSIHNPKGLIYRLLMVEQTPSIQNLEANDHAFSDARNKMINSLSKFLSESITFFMQKCETLQNRLTILSDKQYSFVEQQREIFKETQMAIMPDAKFEDTNFGEVFHVLDRADVQENKAKGLNRLKFLKEKITELTGQIQAELDHLMSLTFHLVKMDDPKITLNSCKIIHDYLKHISRSSSLKSNMGLKYKFVNAAESEELPAQTSEELNGQQLQFLKDKLIQILPIFNQKYALPYQDSEAGDGILAQYQQAIRLQFFDASKQNEQEEVFGNMRSQFDMLMGLFLCHGQLEQSFAENVVDEVNQFREAAKNQGNTLSRSLFIRKVELILKKIQLILWNSSSLNHGHLYSSNMQNSQNQVNSVKDFFKNEQIEFLLFSADTTLQLMADDSAEGESALLFFSLHQTMYNIFNALVHSYSSQIASRQTSTIVKPERIQDIFQYLIVQITKKIKLNRSFMYTSSNEEIELLKNQILLASYIQKCWMQQFDQQRLMQSSECLQQFMSQFLERLQEICQCLVSEAPNFANAATSPSSRQNLNQEFNYLKVMSQVFKIKMVLLLNIFNQSMDQTVKSAAQSQMLLVQDNFFQRLEQAAISFEGENQSLINWLKKQLQYLMLSCLVAYNSCLEEETQVFVQQIQYAKNVGSGVNKDYVEQRVLFLLQASVGIKKKSIRILNLIQENKIVSKCLTDNWNLLQRASQIKDNLTGPVMLSCGIEMTLLDKIEKGDELKHSYLIDISSATFIQIKNEYTTRCVQNTPQANQAYQSQRINQLEHLLCLFKIQFGSSSERSGANDNSSGIPSTASREQASGFGNNQTGTSMQTHVYYLFNRLEFSVVDVNNQKIGYEIMNFISFLMNQLQNLTQGGSFLSSLSNQEQNLIIQLMDVLLQVLESVSFVSIRALGIQNEADLLDLATMLTAIVEQGNILRGQHQIRQNAMKIIKNMLFDLVSQDPAQRVFPFLDSEYEQNRASSLEFVTNKFQQSTKADFEQQLASQNMLRLADASPALKIQVINRIDQFIVMNLWRLGKCESPFDFTTTQLKDNTEFMAYSESFAMMIVAICHFLGNHEQNLNNFVKNSQQVFSGQMVPTMDQIKQMVQDSNALSFIKDCNMFSFNHYKIDKSYPQRLWRLSKNSVLKYDQKYWSYCYELKDSILDYLFGKSKAGTVDMHGFVGEQSQSLNASGAQGQSKKREFIQRFATNLEEFNKVWDDSPDQI